MSLCKLTYFVHLYFADHAKDSTFGVQSDIFSKLRDPFRDLAHRQRDGKTKWHLSFQGSVTLTLFLAPIKLKYKKGPFPCVHMRCVSVWVKKNGFLLGELGVRRDTGGVGTA